MVSLLYGRFGWSDRIGPLWFLAERWACGSRWRPAWARFFAGPRGVALQAHSKKGGYAVAGCFIQAELWSDLSYAQKEEVVMSWLREVRRPEVGLGAGGLASDPVWLSEYPALHEYLTLGTRPDGSSRRTSTLTLFCEHSSWKCFLNERDAHASLCASGDTISGALCALEVMLEAEVAPWRFSDPPAQENGRKGKKRP